MHSVTGFQELGARAYYKNVLENVLDCVNEKFAGLCSSRARSPNNYRGLALTTEAKRMGRINGDYPCELAVLIQISQCG